jgi:membrane protein YdbS with pleckstrin-like domain
MKAPEVPKIWELFHHIWTFLALMLLLAFVFRITGYTALDYGALPAAIVFLVLTLCVIYAIVYATSRPTRDRNMRF